MESALCFSTRFIRNTFRVPTTRSSVRLLSSWHARSSDSTLPLQHVAATSVSRRCVLHQTQPIKLPFGARFTSSDALVKSKVRGIQNNLFPLSTKRIVRRKKTKDSLPRDQEIFEVVSFATAEECNLERLKLAMNEQGLYDELETPNDLPDVLYVEAKYRVDNEPREIIFFREGSIVFWNVPEVERESVMRFAHKFQEDSYDRRLVHEEYENLEYCFTDAPTQLVGDELQIKKPVESQQSQEQLLEKYAVSNALSLSVKLAIWEASLSKYVDSIEWVLEDLKEGKKLRISRADVLKKSGELLTLRHLINLSSDLLDTPDFYWDRDTLETLYNKTCNQFNISRRVKVMNEKLSSCFELTELLRAHLAESHSSNLEWLIIFLIAIEVGFEVIHLVERFC